MKKIMFNDRYGLTAAVLQGRKTMTRRIIRNLSNLDPRQDRIEWGNDEKGKANIAIFLNETYKYCIYPRYQPGEVLAVAQSYETLANFGHLDQMTVPANNPVQFELKKEYTGKGWSNKMFVRADLMPHLIQITHIKIERLQDITDEDCLKEGIGYNNEVGFENGCYYFNDYEGFISPKSAFSTLINRINGKSSWEINPFVFAYSFKLIK